MSGQRDVFDLGGSSVEGGSPLDIAQEKYRQVANKVAAWPQTVLALLIVALVLILWLWMSNSTEKPLAKFEANNPTATMYLQTQEGAAAAPQAVPGAHLPTTIADTLTEFSCKAGRAPAPITYQPWSWAYGDRGTAGDEEDPFAEDQPGASGIMTQDAWEAALNNYKAAHPEKTISQSAHAVNRRERMIPY